MNFTIILLGIVAAVAEIAGGALVVLRKEWPRQIQEYLLALSAGFILALVFLELIPESIIHIGAEAALFILLGYAVIHFFEHTIVEHLHFGEETHDEVMVSKAASYSTFIGLMIHAFFDGFAIAAAYSYDSLLGWLVFGGILLHKFPEGLTIATVMLSARQGRNKALAASITIGVAILLGVLSVLIIEQVNERFIGFAFAFSAGAALYVGASDLVPELNKSHRRISPILVFAGMALFYITLRIVHHYTGHAH
jgi:zinc transporter ZupT